MRDFGSKLADYEALADEPVMDLNSLESERTQFLRQAETEVNNDAEVDENDDDAVRCIPKVMQVSLHFSTVFENHRKSLILQLCEQSELRLHINHNWGH